MFRFIVGTAAFLVTLECALIWRTRYREWRALRAVRKRIRPIGNRAPDPAPSITDRRSLRISGAVFLALLLSGLIAAVHAFIA